MINYLKLHLSYVCSRIFTVIFILVLIGLFLGIIISANLDFGYYYLDSFRTQFYLEYVSQSFLIIEVILTVYLIFITSILSNKTNESLIVYTVDTYKQRFLFILSRYVIATLLNLLSVAICFSFIVIVGSLLTPFMLNLENIFLVLASISFKIYFFQAFVFFLQAFLNHFLIILVPILLFWYQKAIYSYQEVENELTKVVLKIIPSFSEENQKIIFYQSLHFYLIIIIVLFLISFIINLTKDYS